MSLNISVIMSNASDAKMLNEHQALQNTSSKQAFILLIGVLILAGIGIYHTYPIGPSPFSAPSTVFSSLRAMSHVRKIGSKPHPIGSADNAEVRQYLVSQLKQLGLKPEIQSVLMEIPKRHLARQVHNVMVRIPGALPGNALLLAAHYDSVPSGSGAADDGASVAAILETLRAINAQPPLQNDLICLFTDGEEVGLLGAKAFVTHHPWAKEIGLVLNYEYRGNSGAFMMFETSPDNGKLIQGLAKAVPFILTNSLMYEVYQYLPNNTDFTVFKHAGIPGMNFAAIAGHKAYHTQLDRQEFLNQATLQHEGDIMMALVTHFGNQPLGDLKAENQQYFDFPGLGIIHYPMSLAIPLLVILIIVFAVLCVINYKAKTIRIIPTLIALFFYLLVVFVLYIVDSFLWYLIRFFHPDYPAFAFYDTFKSYCYLLGFILLNIMIMCIFYRYAKRWLKAMELNLGMAATWLLLALSTLNNGANFLFYWPLSALLISLALERLPFIKKNLVFNSLALLLGCTPGLLIFTPLIKNLFVGLTPCYMGIILVFLSLLLGLLFPLLAVFDSNTNDVAGQKFKKS
jgi:uncharacterized Tic20 family protein